MSCSFVLRVPPLRGIKFAPRLFVCFMLMPLAQFTDHLSYNVHGLEIPINEREAKGKEWKGRGRDKVTRGEERTKNEQALLSTNLYAPVISPYA